MSDDKDFSHYRYWKSSLFNETYLSVNFQEDYKALWENTEAGELANFVQEFLDFCEEIDPRDLKTWTETDTISNWIKPIIRMLGWHSKCSSNTNPIIEEATFTLDENGKMKSYRPDMVLVDDPSQKKLIRPDNRKSADREKAIHKAILPIEAKYWNRLEEFESGAKADANKANQKQRDNVSASSPNQQIIKYMDVLEKQWGILTDGRTWRLFNLEASKKSIETYFEFDLYALYELARAGVTDKSRRDAFIRESKYFFFMFSKLGLYKGVNGNPIVDGIWEYSKKYVDKAEDDLRERFVRAMSKTFNGVVSTIGKKIDKEEISFIRGTSESYLFNLLFLKYCESRNILPTLAPDYKNEVSLSFVLDHLENYDPDEDKHLRLSYLKENFASLFQFEENGFEIFDRTLKLIKSVQGGSDRTGRFGFHTKSTLLESDQLKFLQNNKVSNLVMIDVLFELGYTKSNLKGRQYQQIPYSSFSPRQLGSIYESLLEYRLVLAEFDQVEENGRWKPVNVKSTKAKKLKSRVCHRGEFFVERQALDRKMSGSFYTKDVLVSEIVQSTVAPYLETLPAEKIYSLKVVDPSMGSGHFLSSALRFLAEAWIEKKNDEAIDDIDFNSTEIKTKILKNCIHGFDINERAVKLAKLSLWLETARKGHQLTDLETNLVAADTIVPKTKKHPTGFETTKGEFDIILSNPPWDKLKFDELEFFKQNTHLSIPKSISKSVKASLFKKAMADREIAKAYENEKLATENKIEAVESVFYEYQANISQISKSRHIDHNLYKLALERWLRLLKPNGRMGIVIPSGYLGDLGSSGIRKYMLDNYALEQIWGFEETAKVFPISQACIYMILQGGKPTDKFSYVDNIENIGAFEKLLKNKKNMPEMSREVIEALDPDTWTISFIKDDNERTILNGLYRYCKRKGRLKFDFGRELHQTDNANDIHSERGLIRVLKGDEIDAFFVRSPGKQYLNERGLKKYATKTRVDRIGIRAIANRKLSKRLVACVVPNSMLTVNSILVSKGNYAEDEMFFILGLFNSRIVEYRFRQIAKNNNVNKFAVNALPLPQFDAKDSSHLAISRQCKKLHDAGKGLPTSKADFLDYAIGEMFGLREAQIKHILKSFEKDQPQKPTSKKVS